MMPRYPVACRGRLTKNKRRMKKFLSLLLTPTLLAVPNHLPAQGVASAYPRGPQTYSSPANAWYGLRSYSNGLYYATGGSNTAAGSNALFSGGQSDHTPVNWDALESNTNGVDNPAAGWDALENNTNRVDMKANGWDAFLNHATGADPTDTGWDSLETNTAGFYHTANAVQALPDDTTGGDTLSPGDQTRFDIYIATLGLAGDTNLIHIAPPDTQTNALIPDRIIAVGGGRTNLKVGQMPAAVPTNH